MKFPFVPDYYFPDIYAIDPERLRARGVKVLLADLDNTLAPYGVPKPSGEVVAWRARLEQAGIPVLRFVADPVDPRKLSRDNMLAMVEDFIENRVIPNAGK